MTLSRRPMERPIMPLRTALERLMGEWPFVQVDGGLTELAPPIDVRDNEDAYVIEVDLPGIEAQDIEVLIEGRTVTIRGTVAEERREDQGAYLLRERRQGQFMRAVALPGMVDVDQVESTFENGKLTIRLPKAAQNRARRIEVPGAQGGQARMSAGSQAGRSGDGGTQRAGGAEAGVQGGAPGQAGTQGAGAGGETSRTAETAGTSGAAGGSGTTGSGSSRS